MTIKMTKKGNAKNIETGEKYKAVSQLRCTGCAFVWGTAECNELLCGPHSRANYPNYQVKGSVIFVRKEKSGA